MEIVCPECSSTFPGIEGVLQTCPACMHSFELEPKTGDRIPDLMKIQLQGPLGEALGTHDIYQLKQQVYQGALTGREFMRFPGGEWVPVYEHPDLESLFELIGLDMVAIRLSSQKVKGWQKDDSAKKVAAQKKAKSGIQAVHGSEVRSREFQNLGTKKESGGPPSWLPIVGGIALVGLLLYVLL